MRKRLRKKTHRGEFREWGAPLSIVRTQDEAFDTFLDDFLEYGIEANDCFFGGGGSYKRLEGIVELGCVSDDFEAKLDCVIKWLESRQDVERYDVGDLVDLWHGPFDFMDSWGPETGNAEDG